MGSSKGGLEGKTSIVTLDHASLRARDIGCWAWSRKGLGDSILSVQLGPWWLWPWQNLLVPLSFPLTGLILPVRKLPSETQNYTRQHHVKHAGRGVRGQSKHGSQIRAQVAV